MNRKSIQILRGSETYDPETSEEILLDGQPFYSKKTKRLYIGDGESKLSELKGTQIGDAVNINSDATKLVYSKDAVDKNVTIDMLEIKDISTIDDSVTADIKLLTQLPNNEIGWMENHRIILVDLYYNYPEDRNITYPDITPDILSQIRYASTLGIPIILRYDSESGDFQDWHVVYVNTNTGSENSLVLLSNNAVIVYKNFSPTIYPLLTKEQLNAKLSSKSDIYPEQPPTGTAVVQVRNNFYGEDKIEYFEIKVTPTPWTVARRDENGNLRVGDAVLAEDAMNKRMVTSAITAAQIPTTPSVTVNGNSVISNGITINPKGYNIGKIDGDADVVKPSDTILEYTISGKLCCVNYAFTASVDIPASGVCIATGLPPAANTKQYFSCVSTPHDTATDQELHLVNFMVNTAGEVRTQYASIFKANHYVKGGFTYIISGSTSN